MAGATKKTISGTGLFWTWYFYRDDVKVLLWSPLVDKATQHRRTAALQRGVNPEKHSKRKQEDVVSPSTEEVDVAGNSLGSGVRVLLH